MSGPNKGKPYEPSTFDKYMEQLTLVFQDAGVQHSYAQDFNKGGEFHGIVLEKWNQIRQEDPKFGTGSNRARVDTDLFTKFVSAIRSGEIRPYEDREHLVICIIFVLGFYCGLRGSDEHVNLMTENIFMGEYTAADGEDLCGLKYVGIKVPFSKAKQLKLKCTRLPKDEDVLLTFVEDPRHDCWCPFQVFCFYVDKCHPLATKFYARFVKVDGEEEKILKKTYGKEIWFAESGPKRSNWNMGPTKHRDLCKDVARLAGVQRWEDCTGHALRALCITHCICSGLSAADVAAKVRHASLNSQTSYAQGSNKRKANRMAVMNPSGTLAKKAKKAQVQVPAASAKKNQEIVELSEKYPVAITQPFKAENRAQFDRLTSEVSRTAKYEAIVDEKENESPNSKLQRLETENKILRLQQENARMKAELEAVPAPPRYRSSYPPNNSHGSGGHRHGGGRFNPDNDFAVESPVFRTPRHEGNYRHSHPPHRRERLDTPPPHYQQLSRRHGEENLDWYGDYHRGYH